MSDNPQVRLVCWSLEWAAGPGGSLIFVPVLLVLIVLYKHSNCYLVSFKLG
jgi:hypothetical protein